MILELLRSARMRTFDKSVRRFRGCNVWTFVDVSRWRSFGNNCINAFIFDKNCGECADKQSGRSIECSVRSSSTWSDACTVSWLSGIRMMFLYVSAIKHTAFYVWNRIENSSSSMKRTCRVKSRLLTRITILNDPPLKIHSRSAFFCSLLHYQRAIWPVIAIRFCALEYVVEGDGRRAPLSEDKYFNSEQLPFLIPF